MALNPVFEHQADRDVSRNYRAIKEALGATSLPLFFSYIGAFPEYLEYITPQLAKNLQDDAFIKLCQETLTAIKGTTESVFTPSEDAKEFLDRYRETPSMYHFRADIKGIVETNMKLAFVFIALREAVKGWAIAARRLPAQSGAVNREEVNQELIRAETGLVYGDIPMSNNSDDKEKGEFVMVEGKIKFEKVGMTTASPHGLDRQLLPEYLSICRGDYEALMKREIYLYSRLGAEKLILASLPLFPNLIFSPINEVLRLTGKYPDFPDLLYLVSEHFPTFAIQRLLFSLYLRNG